MRSIVFYIFLLLSTVTLSNNEAQVDSLLNKAKEVFRDNKYLAFQLETKALVLAKSLDYVAGIVKSNYYLGFYFDNQGNYPESIVHYLDATKIESSDMDSVTIGWMILANKNLGNTFYYHEAFGLAEEYLSRGLDLSREIKNKKQERSLLFSIYRNFYKANNLQLAKFALYELKNLAAAESNDYFRSVNGLALISLILKEYIEAEKQSLELLQSAQDDNNLLYQSFAHHNLGDIYSELGEKQKSIFHYRQAIAIKIELNSSNTYSLFLSYESLGDLFSENGNTQDALVNYNNALGLFDRIKDHPDNFYFYEKLAKFHSSLGDDILSEKYRNTKSQAKIEFTLQQSNMQLIVNGYYEELAANRKQEQSQKIFIAIIVGLSTMLLVFVGHSITKRYQFKRMLARALDRLEWTD